jgi:hypothetical protein
MKLLHRRLKGRPRRPPLWAEADVRFWRARWQANRCSPHGEAQMRGLCRRLRGEG